MKVLRPQAQTLNSRLSRRGFLIRGASAAAAAVALPKTLGGSKAVAAVGIKSPNGIIDPTCSPFNHVQFAQTTGPDLLKIEGLPHKIRKEIEILIEHQAQVPDLPPIPPPIPPIPRYICLPVENKEVTCDGIKGHIPIFTNVNGFSIAASTRVDGSVNYTQPIFWGSHNEVITAITSGAETAHRASGRKILPDRRGFISRFFQPVLATKI